jgi:two-component system chemotaxis response regulator CheB
VPGHDIIVIGASKGSGRALYQLAATLPRRLPAAVFVVVHLPVFPASHLPELLRRCGPVDAAFAVHGEPIRQGRLYVAPADRQLRIEFGRVGLHRQLLERQSRPSIDAVFRTAATAYGPRVVGVVMSGLLHDGSAGLSWIKRRGGVTIVQDPAESPEPSMPLHALAQAPVDHCVTVEAMAPLLVELARRTVRPASRPESPEETSWWLSLGSALRIEDPPAPRTATGHEARDGQAGTSRPLVRTPDPAAPAPAET